MKTLPPLQDVIDPFVTSVGGELIRELVGNNNPPLNADYLFREHNVIAELKTLRNDSFGGPFRKKVGDLMGRWHRQGRHRLYGMRTIQTRELPEDYQQEIFDLLAKPLQNHIVRGANDQIRSTKNALAMTAAKGLLWIASDGNTDLPPNVVWYLLTRILQKKQDGRHSYSNINGLAYFNPRMPAHVPSMDRPAFFWFSGSRPKDDQQMGACLDRLFHAWFTYLESSYGIVIRQMGTESVSPQDVGFWGVPPNVPLIHVNYAHSADQRKK